MILSFTGTRKGMNEVQKELFQQLVDEINPKVFVHGDCDGADEDAHNIIVSKGNIEIHKRPCTFDNQRAFTKEGTCVAEPEYALDRNKKIVDDGEILIATPGENKEVLRSGTWSTIRYASKTNKPVVIIYPNGKVEL
jgi:hypothetical protein